MKKFIFFIFCLLGIRSLSVANCLIHDQRADIKIEDPRLADEKNWAFCSYEDGRFFDLDYQAFDRRLESLLSIQMISREQAQSLSHQAQINRKSMRNALFPQSEGGHARESLVTVTSTYIDLGSNQEISLAGIGSLIAKVSSLPHNRISVLKAHTKYYVLTAGHLAKGNRLKVFNSRREELFVQKIYLDDEFDLALLELGQNPFTQPLAYWATDATGQRLATYLEDINHGSELTKDKISGLSYPITVAESALHYRISPYPTFLVGKNMKWREESFSVLPRGQKVESFELSWSLPAGLSGSPLVSDQNQTYLTLTGVAIMAALSDPEESRTLIAGPKAIYDLLAKGMEGKSQPAISEWIFVNGFPIRMTDKSLEIFMRQKPIGNGVYVNGLSKDEKFLGKNDKDIQILKNSLRKGKLIEPEKIILDLKNSQKKIIIR